MCNQDDATVKLILRGSKHEVSICKVKTGKWNEETCSVFFRHISFIFARSYYRLLYPEFQPERNKIGWVHALLSLIKTFILWYVLTDRIAPCWVLRSKFYTNEIPLSFFSQLFNLCFRISNTNLNISKRQANLLKPNRRTLDNSLWLNHLPTHLFITVSEQLQCIQAIFQDKSFRKIKT